MRATSGQSRRKTRLDLIRGGPQQDDADAPAPVHSPDKRPFQAGREPRPLVALYTLFYNFIWTHGKLRISPAMAAGIATTFMSFEDMMSRVEAAKAPAKVRGPYNKRG